jgi:predicted O-methyltransferase YrrM
MYRLPTVSISHLATARDFRSEAITDGVGLPPLTVGKHDDFSALMSIVSTLRPRTVVELGTAYGNTTANICRVCADTRVYTVNALPEQIGGRLTTYILSREEIGSVYRRYGFSDQVVQIYCDTMELDLSNHLPGPIVDLAIIDACHDTKYVINDFLKVAPFVRPEGMILLHDTHPCVREHLWGSYIGCMILKRRGYDIFHIANTWWGVWRKPDPAQEHSRT